MIPHVITCYCTVNNMCWAMRVIPLAIPWSCLPTPMEQVPTLRWNALKVYKSGTSCALLLPSTRGCARFEGISIVYSLQGKRSWHFIGKIEVRWKSYELVIVYWKFQWYWANFQWLHSYELCEFYFLGDYKLYWHPWRNDCTRK